MESDKSRKPLASAPPDVVRAPSLKAALRQVRRLHGAQARIMESRTVEVQSADGLSSRKMVEVLIAPFGAAASEPAPAGPSLRGPQAQPQASGPMAERFAQEIARIEALVGDLVQERSLHPSAAADLQGYPLADELLERGAGIDAVRRLALDFSARSHDRVADPQAARRHLRSVLRTSGTGWDSFGGCHVLLGDSGSGKTSLTLAIAARLHGLGKHILVLNLLPRHGGAVRRLQLEASQYGYDAAIIQAGEQLVRTAEHLQRYDAVLMDTPAIFANRLLADGEMQRFIASNESLHRHLVVPLDLDFMDADDLWRAARRWNCDWTAISRLDRSRRSGKILDLLGKIPLPISLLAAGSWPESDAQIARSEDLLGRLVGEPHGAEVLSAEA